MIQSNSKGRNHSSRLWQGMLGSWEMQKNERKLVFRMASLGPVCQAGLDHSLVTDGCSPCRAKNPSQEFTEVHGRVCGASRAAGPGSCTPEGHRGQGAWKLLPRAPGWRTDFPASQKSSPNMSSNGLEELRLWKRKTTVYFCTLLIATPRPRLDLHTSWIQNVPGASQDMLFPSCVPHPVQLGFGSLK